MNCLFAGDFHITESSLVEINNIFAELLTIIDKAQITRFVITGDSFDKINPTSKELDCFATFLNAIACPTIILAANSHESTTPEDSIINHFGILKDNIITCKEYIDNNLFVGHFGVKESKLTRDGTVEKRELHQYQYVILGHNHTWELIPPNICQLGSVRFVNFNEDTKVPKKIGICYNFKDEKQKWAFFNLTSCLPMTNVCLEKTPEYSGAPEAEIVQPRASEEQIDATYKYLPDLLAHLDKLSAKTKVRVIFKDYNSWREFLPFSTKYKNKFSLYKEKKSFIIDLVTNCEKKENKSLKDTLIEYLKANQVPESIGQIILEEIK